MDNFHGMKATKYSQKESQKIQPRVQVIRHYWLGWLIIIIWIKMNISAPAAKAYKAIIPRPQQFRRKENTPARNAQTVSDASGPEPHNQQMMENPCFFPRPT